MSDTSTQNSREEPNAGIYDNSFNEKDEFGYTKQELDLAKKILDKYNTQYPRYRDCVRAYVELKYNKIMDIVVQVDRDDYQGDSIIIGKDGDDQYYYCSFGWGSCGGCDMMEGNSDEGHVERTVLDLSSSVVPIPHNNDNERIAEVIGYLNRELQNAYSKDLIKEAIIKINNLPNEEYYK